MDREDLKFQWVYDNDCNCHRAYDDYAMYVISGSKESAFQVGYFPAPGPECLWKDKIGSLDEAKIAAIDCARHIMELRKREEDG